MFKEGNGILRLQAFVTCGACNRVTTNILTAAGIADRKGFERSLRRDGWKLNKRRRWICDGCANPAPKAVKKLPRDSENAPF